MTQNFAAITEPAKVGELLRAFDSFNGTYPVACALKLAPLLFVRPGELRTMEWAAVDLDKGEWRYIVPKTRPRILSRCAARRWRFCATCKP
ncbi:hypothetical protein CDEF62S_02768 [Castellaniella defragrans]